MAAASYDPDAFDPEDFFAGFAAPFAETPLVEAPSGAGLSEAATAVSLDTRTYLWLGTRRTGALRLSGRPWCGHEA